MIVRLREQAATYAELEDAFSAEIEQACTGGGAIAIKSVIAYRTGLDVAEWPRAEVEATYLQWAEAGFPETRELAKPVRDALLDPHARGRKAAPNAGAHPLRRR